MQSNLSMLFHNQQQLLLLPLPRTSQVAKNKKNFFRLTESSFCHDHILSFRSLSSVCQCQLVQAMNGILTMTNEHTYICMEI